MEVPEKKGQRDSVESVALGLAPGQASVPRAELRVYRIQSMLATINIIINSYSIPIESISIPPELKVQMKGRSDSASGESSGRSGVRCADYRA